ncbi:hypothetical protein [Lewinella cohaerens]|uniref:hypothetical protein n=1 Tax=Lewinella cohaerens TaxID=70995 RepID=UPI00035E2699|nr:hypothetical protein [Lewinella cohaerens]
MKLRIALICGLMAIGLWGWGQVEHQPQRLHYFPDNGRNYSILDPGQELLQRNLMISNQAGGYGVSFALSFDKSSWNGFALGPRYSSIFSLDGEEGCYIRIRTQFGETPESITEIVYFLIRGKCYSVYWNTTLKRWDLVENACRAN